MYVKNCAEEDHRKLKIEKWKWTYTLQEIFPLKILLTAIRSKNIPNLTPLDFYIEKNPSMGVYTGARVRDNAHLRERISKARA